jgi:hypothetical protein
LDTKYFAAIDLPLNGGRILNPYAKSAWSSAFRFVQAFGFPDVRVIKKTGAGPDLFTSLTLFRPRIEWGKDKGGGCECNKHAERRLAD